MKLLYLILAALPFLPLLGMAGSFANYLEDKVLDHVFGGGDYTRPATVYIALFTARGTDAQSDAGTNFTEVPTGTWSNYARKSVTNNSTNFPASSGGAKSNGIDITFPAATTSADVTVIAAGIYDASTGGNLLGWATLAANKTVQNGDVFSVPTGSLAFTLD